MAGLGHDHSIHQIGAERGSYVWDNSLAPALEVESGTTVELECADASGGQLTKNSTADDVGKMDLTRVNPVTGPVYVKGAEEGDVLAVEILDLRPRDWGWTAIIPEFGLLADAFPEAWLNISTVDTESQQVQFLPGVTLPFAPFPGTIGVAPAQPGEHPTLVPTKWGGNMDIKHLRPGSTLYLPVAVEGGLFAVGDTHAAMGDAEVCGTAVEAAMDIAVRLTVHKGWRIPYPQYHVKAGQLADSEPSSYHVCTGIGPDLFVATKEATWGAITHIERTYGRTREEAYAIASVAVDLRIHEIVDAPNWTVGAFLPEAIFTDSP